MNPDIERTLKFFDELTIMAAFWQTSLDEDVRHCGYELMELLERFKVI